MRISSGVVLIIATVVLGSSWQPSSSARARPGAVRIVQAFPEAAVDLSVDGQAVQRAVRVGAIVGPLSMTPGTHVVQFTDQAAGTRIKTSVRVRPGSSSDVVLHRPAAVSGPPVVNTYSTPRTMIGPGKARVLVAHTATVAPADVRVDGQTVFTNIANGEYAEADLPSGHHRVALLPTGERSHPILGPLDVDLRAQTTTFVYAVGRPSNGSMRVIMHSESIRADGTAAPGAIHTGSAGLVARVRVQPFGTRHAGVPVAAGAVLAAPWVP